MDFNLRTTAGNWVYRSSTVLLFCLLLSYPKGNSYGKICKSYIAYIQIMALTMHFPHKCSYRRQINKNSRHLLQKVFSTAWSHFVRQVCTGIHFFCSASDLDCYFSAACILFFIMFYCFYLILFEPRITRWDG